MERRKAKRTRPSNKIDIESEILKEMDEHEKMQEKELLDLIARIIVKATLDEIMATIRHINNLLFEYQINRKI